jgi:copper chaperone CopZ
MKTKQFEANRNLCGDCSMALRRFVGNLDGVDSISVENQKIAVTFDETSADEELITRITRESVEKLGYKIASDL